MKKRIPVILDTDISLGTPNAEIDDGAALILLTNMPQIELKAVTTVHGNVPVETATLNLMRMMDYLDNFHIPIAQGASSPLCNDVDWSVFLSNWQAQYGETPSVEHQYPDTDAVDLMIETIRNYSGEVVVLALGPLTNLALALKRDPEISGMLKSVIAMGGSLNESGQAEFNIRCDPEAAKAVLLAGLPLKLHGLEITRQPLFSREDFYSLDPQHPAQALLQAQAFGWIEIVERQGWEQGGCSLHDAVAAAAVAMPDLFTYMPGHLDVITEFGPQRGVTRVEPDSARPAAQVASGINASACHTYILEKLKE